MGIGYVSSPVAGSVFSVGRSSPASIPSEGYPVLSLRGWGFLSKSVTFPCTAA